MCKCVSIGVGGGHEVGKGWLGEQNHKRRGRGGGRHVRRRTTPRRETGTFLRAPRVCHLARAYTRVNVRRLRRGAIVSGTTRRPRENAEKIASVFPLTAMLL